MPTSAASVVRPGRIASAATPATSATLVTALSASKRMLGPNRLRAPEMGLIRLKSSASALGAGRNPTWAAPAKRPAPRQIAAIGPTVSASVLTPTSISECSPLAVVALAGVAISARISRKAAWAAPTTEGPSSVIANSPPASTSEPPTSAERAICPFLRARSRCLGVGFSVRSSCAMAYPTCRAPSAAPTQVDIWLAIQPATNGSEAPTTQQRDGHLGGEADGEHVELGHHARDHAEGDVGDQQRDQHRRSDLHGGCEHGGEDLLGAATRGW